MDCVAPFGFQKEMMLIPTKVYRASINLLTKKFLSFQRLKNFAATSFKNLKLKFPTDFLYMAIKKQTRENAA